MEALVPRRYRLIVFDWDGTLVDSTSIIAGSLRAACRDIGWPEPADVDARYVIGLGLHDAIRHVAPGLEREDLSALTDRYRHHFLAREGEIAFFPGAEALLDELADAGYLLGVATGKTRKGLDRALRAAALLDRFHATRCADESAPKPDPAMLRWLIDQLGVTPAQTLMIGDTTHDLQVARGAGADSIALTHGAHHAEGLAEEDPLALLSSIDALREWLVRNG